MKNSFKGCLKLDSSLCFYLYDYVSVSHNLKASTDLKKTINLLFRMKGDHIVSLTAKLFSLAMSRIYIITDKKDTSILISIPAYPQQAHATIFIFLPSAVRKNGYQEQLQCHPNRIRPCRQNFQSEIQSIIILRQASYTHRDILNSKTSFIQIKKNLST